MPITAKGRKAKGADYEREVAAYVNEKTGLSTKRALLSGGGSVEGGADISNTPLVHLELKRTETFRPHEAMKQAEECLARTRSTAAPVVVTRRSNMKTGQSLVVMRLDDWLRWYSHALEQEGLEVSR